jgi:protein-S-isoprenylcysteine O-methyltransferase Ste14
MSAYLIVAPWIVFYVYWVINAWSVKATAERQSLASSLPNRCLTLAGGILLFWRSPPHPLETRFIPNTMTAGCSGLGICLLGLALAIWSRNTLGRNWSSVVTLKKEHELVERGPYRFVRHPIYSAILLMSTGTAVAFGRLGCWLGLLLLFWGFWLKLRQEEALLTRNFPAEYPGYMKRVKALVPYVFMGSVGLFALAPGTARSADAVQPVQPSGMPIPEERRRMGELAARDRRRMMDLLHLTEPVLPPPANDPLRPVNIHPFSEFKACAAAGPANRLLGMKDMGTTELPSLDAGVTGGDIGFRLHAGGHTYLLEWPAFLKFADRYLAESKPPGSPK